MENNIEIQECSKPEWSISYWTKQGKIKTVKVQANDAKEARDTVQGYKDFDRVIVQDLNKGEKIT